MKLLLFFTLLLFGFNAWAQNDNCATAIELPITGINEACPTTIYSNTAATDALGTAVSPIGTCFNGLLAFKDVWFKFTTGSIGYQNYKIDVTGVETADSIRRPQMALYIGNCTDGLLQEFCITQPKGVLSRGVRIDAGNMRPNTTYYMQVANFQSTDAGGNFTACVRPFDPIYNLTLLPQTSTAYQGTLYDSGGPFGNYGNNENENVAGTKNFDNYTFNIRPNGASCVDLFFEQLNTESNVDTILIIDGNSGVVLDRLSGATNKEIRYTVHTNWVKVQFRSDAIATGPGFKLNWLGSNKCNAIPKATSCQNAENIAALPFFKNATSCFDALGSVQTTPCLPRAKFIEGKDHVYKFSAKGNQCVSIKIGNIPTALYSGISSTVGAGLGLYRGCPNDANSVCIAQGKFSGYKDSLIIKNASLDVADDYYIVVGRKEACMPYTISIEEAVCLNSLPNAGYCNKALTLNDCSTAAPSDIVLDLSGGGDTSFVSFSPNTPNVGCIRSYGTVPPQYNFVFLTFQAQADGKFAFTLGPINTDDPSDIDFNVYGPIDSASQVCDYAKKSFPIRSSYGQERFFVPNKRTGMVNSYVNFYGKTIAPTDTCEFNDGDGLLKPLNVEKGKYYVIWINDYLGTIGKNGVRLQFDGTTPGVLDSFNNPLSRFTISKDTFMCAGASTQLSASGGITYKWTPNTSLNNATSNAPIASPSQTTQYNATIQGTCKVVTKSVNVGVLNIRKLPDQTVCNGQKLQFTAGENLPSMSNATWLWTSPSGNSSELNSTSSATVNFTAKNSTGNLETHTFIVTLNSPTCSFADTFNVFVNPQTAANFEVVTAPKRSRDTSICIGNSFKLLKAGFESNAFYRWTTSDGENLSADNPIIAPMKNTKYFVTVVGGNSNCPSPIYDSVIVNVFLPASLNLAKDTAVCRDTKISLGNTVLENNTNYFWSPQLGIENVNDPNSFLTVQPSLSDKVPIQYVLTATNAGGCVTRDSIKIIGIDITLKITPTDSLRLCRGTSINLSATTSPKINSAVKWSSDKDFYLNDSINKISAKPTRVTKYFATLSQNVCTRTDSVIIYVDSLPFNTKIIPQDSTICQNAIVVLRSPTYESVLFPNLKSFWSGGKGFLTSDTLFDMVIQGDTTRTYSRINTNGVCQNVDTVKVFVTPLPKVSLTPANTIFCSNDNVNVTLFAEITPTNPSSIKWKDAQGQDIKSAEGKKSTIVNSQNSGTYTVEVKNGNCPASASATIQNVTAPEFGLPKNIICAGDSVALNTKPNAAYTYAWTGSNAFSSSLPAPIVKPKDVTTYAVSVSNNSNNCVAKFNFTITPAFGTLAPLRDTFVCQGSALTLLANGSNNIANGIYVWSSGETMQSIIIPAAKSGIYTVTYTYGDNCTLRSSARIDTTFISAKILPDTFDKFVDQGTILKLFGSSNGISSKNFPFTWKLNDAPVAASDSNSVIFPIFEDTKVTVTAKSSYGCLGSASTNIKVRYPSFQSPNAFTPNGDAVNPNFNLVFSDGSGIIPQEAFPKLWKGNLKLVSFQIFSRNNKILYGETNEAVLNADSFLGWDGKSEGADVSPDVYVYLITLRFPDGKTKNVSGEVTLIR